MRSPRRVLLYGLGVWIGLVVVSLVLLPFEDANNALYESVKSSALVAIALGFTIRYMRKATETSLGEGVLVGLVWAVMAVALDLVLYLLGAFTIGIAEYFSDVASSYLIIPIVTVLAMTYLAPDTARKRLR